MAGSFKHVVAADGQLLRDKDFAQMVDNPVDAYEVVEEMYGMIWVLADFLGGPDAGTRRAWVDQARDNYRRGLTVSPGTRGRLAEDDKDESPEPPDDTEAARAMYTAAQTIKQTGGAVEIGGVRITQCDEHGREIGTGKDRPSDLVDRLRRAVERLEERRDRHAVYTHEHSRLSGKIEGVKLAASYLEDQERIFPPEPPSEENAYLTTDRKVSQRYVLPDESHLLFPSTPMSRAMAAFEYEAHEIDRSGETKNTDLLSLTFTVRPERVIGTTRPVATMTLIVRPKDTPTT